ncbi:hypothetical protein [Paracidovorax konjaci]|uniref:hypothetical protein n=1 Tax=Paracidovorax konjaci TaxID=32040 RepID=UPI0015877A63|nr:hypothetical protein [Paracidovorax konjaci]
MRSISPAGAALSLLRRLAYWPSTVLPVPSSAYTVENFPKPRIQPLSAFINQRFTTHKFADREILRGSPWLRDCGVSAAGEEIFFSILSRSSKNFYTPIKPNLTI